MFNAEHLLLPTQPTVREVPAAAHTESVERNRLFEMCEAILDIAQQYERVLLHHDEDAIKLAVRYHVKKDVFLKHLQVLKAKHSLSTEERLYPDFLSSIHAKSDVRTDLQNIQRYYQLLSSLVNVSEVAH